VYFEAGYASGLGISVISTYTFRVSWRSPHQLTVPLPFIGNLILAC
jgi:hypothetical protein